MFIMSTKEELSESMNGNDIEKARNKIEAFLCGQISKNIKYEIEHNERAAYLKGTIIIDNGAAV